MVNDQYPKKDYHRYSHTKKQAKLKIPNAASFFGVFKKLKILPIDIEGVVGVIEAQFVFPLK